MMYRITPENIIFCSEFSYVSQSTSVLPFKCGVEVLRLSLSHILRREFTL